MNISERLENISVAKSRYNAKKYLILVEGIDYKYFDLSYGGSGWEESDFEFHIKKGDTAYFSNNKIDWYRAELRSITLDGNKLFVGVMGTALGESREDYKYIKPYFKPCTKPNNEELAKRYTTKD